MRLDGKVAIVTGGASGMGRAIVVEMAKEGARVVAADIDLDGAQAVVDQVTEAGGAAVAVRADVTSKADVENLAKATIDHYGRIDVLVNNAGVRLVRSLLEHTEDDWDRMMSINLKSQFLCSQAVLPAMLTQGGGRIINSGSVASLVGRPHRVAYCAAKAGVLGLTRAMAIDLRHRNICVNAILPGSMATALNQDAVDDDDADWGGETLVGRWGEPEEVAHVAVFLASDEASYITGSEIKVEGGWLAARARDGEL